jgi:hypothetical protein
VVSEKVEEMVLSRVRRVSVNKVRVSLIWRSSAEDLLRSETILA